MMSRGRIIPALVVLGALALALGLYLYHMGPAWRVRTLLESFKPSNRSPQARIGHLLGDREPSGPAGGRWFSDPPLVDPVIDQLVQIGPRAVGPLCKELNGPHPDLRWAAAVALGRMGDPRAVAPLIATLNDDYPIVREWTIGSLVQLGDASAVEPIVGALTDADAYVRHTAAAALGEFGDDRAIGPLMGAMSDQDADVRAAAAEALKKIRSGQP